jgi:hypothetical protein
MNVKYNTNDLSERLLYIENLEHKIKCLKGQIIANNEGESKIREHKVRLERFQQELNKFKGSNMDRIPLTDNDEHHDKAQVGCESEIPFDLLVANKYKQLYNSAMSRKKEFALTLNDVSKLLKRKTCQYTGVTFGEGDLCRSIDRFDNKIGYTKENCFAVTKRANDIKNHLLEREDSALGLKFKELKRFVESLDKLGFKS